MLSSQMEQVLALLDQIPTAQTVAAMRTADQQLADRLPKPNDAQVTTVEVHGRLADWVVAPSSQQTSTILYLHGGGYAIGSRHSHRTWAYNLSRESDAQVLVLDYRLAPEHPFPAALNDAVNAYRWLVHEQGISSQQMAIAGDSAGGGLTLATLVALKEAGDPLPAAAVCVSPWVDLAGTGESMQTQVKNDPLVQPWMIRQFASGYLQTQPLTTPLASPLYADLSQLPPMLIQVGTREILLDDSLRLAEQIRAVGGQVELKIWPEMIHVWPLFAPMLDEGRDAIAEAGEFLKTHLKKAL